MSKFVVVLSGPIAVGKSSFARAMEAAYSTFKISTRRYILDNTDSTEDRAALQAAGDQLDQKTDGAWVADAVAQQAKGAGNASILLIDSARIASQVTRLREAFGARQVLHVHLTAPEAVLSDRYLARSPEVREFSTYAEARKSQTEAAVGDLAKIADVVVDTSCLEPPSQVAYALGGRLELTSHQEKLVDVIVGCQWGSEGKGNICAYLAGEYSVLMRVGGPNAGHKVADPKYTYVQLPSGTGTNRDAQILIGAGSTIWLEKLLKEIEDHPWLKSNRNLVIDAQAMIIDQSDRDLEARLLGAIGSTKQGVGAATARKILGRGCEPPFGPNVKLAKDEPALSQFVGDTKLELDKAYRSRRRIMLEGTQGTDLSIHHGVYPFVTSRETTASGCLADAGVGPHRVRKVILVTRTYPIRVGGNSGPMGIKTTFEEIAEVSGLPVESIRSTEIGSVSGKERRIAKFGWEQLRRSAEINGATDIALTFADYLGSDNRSATDFKSLTARTRSFILDMERVSTTPVTLISKGFGRSEVIDRRSW